MLTLLGLPATLWPLLFFSRFFHQSAQPVMDEQQQERLRKRYLDRGRASPLSMAGMGVELAGIVAVLTLGGWWIDQKWDTEPWLMLVGLVIGSVGGMYNLYRRGKRFFQK